jgi:hypothetical protein
VSNEKRDDLTLHLDSTLFATAFQTWVKRFDGPMQLHGTDAGVSYSVVTRHTQLTQGDSRVLLFAARFQVFDPLTEMNVYVVPAPSTTSGLHVSHGPAVSLVLATALKFVAWCCCWPDWVARADLSIGCAYPTQLSQLIIEASHAKPASAHGNGIRRCTVWCLYIVNG